MTFLCALKTASLLSRNFISISMVETQSLSDADRVAVKHSESDVT